MFYDSHAERGGAWSIFPPRKKKRFPTRKAILFEARSCTPRAAARRMKIHSANEVPCSDAILSEPHIAMCAKSGGSRNIPNGFWRTATPEGAENVMEKETIPLRWSCCCKWLFIILPMPHNHRAKQDASGERSRGLRRSDS